MKRTLVIAALLATALTGCSGDDSPDDQLGAPSPTTSSCKAATSTNADLKTKPTFTGSDCAAPATCVRGTCTMVVEQPLTVPPPLVRISDAFEGPLASPDTASSPPSAPPPDDAHAAERLYWTAFLLALWLVLTFAHAARISDAFLARTGSSAVRPRRASGSMPSSPLVTATHVHDPFAYHADVGAAPSPFLVGPV